MPTADDTIPRPGYPERFVLVAYVVAVVILMVFLHAVVPDARGFGTHEQLGMTPCSWPRSMGIPCPTCGCTTAASHLAHGEFLTAVVVQPFGVFFTVAGLYGVWLALFHLATNRSLMWRISTWPWARLLLLTICLCLLAWVYKIVAFRFAAGS